MDEATAAIEVTRVGHGRTRDRDLVAVEEPLEIRLGFATEGTRRRKAISITMRTPGDDFDLATGFLFTEQILGSARDIQAIEYCGPADRDGRRNTVLVELSDGVAIDLARLERHFYTTSSCGVCGKSSIDALRFAGPPPSPRARGAVPARRIRDLPALLRRQQRVFEATGGLHAAGIFTFEGEPVEVREDVGRHNAVDKVIGAALRHGRVPLDDHMLVVSGRASFELAQKAVVAGIPILAAVGAPSSLAITLAETYGLTIAGFVRAEGLNVYTHAERIALD